MGDKAMAATTEEAYFSDILKWLHIKALRMLERMGDRSPHAAAAGSYDDMPADWWTSGFWPGMLWIMYDMTGEARFKDGAWPWDERIEAYFSLPIKELHHDVGFQFLATAVIKHTLTGDEEGLRRGIVAANYLAGRFNPAGNYIRAWNDQPYAAEPYGLAIIDCMMNISLLFWASRVTGDPRYRHIAVRHADTTLQHFIRDDGAVNHIVRFDPESGDYIEALGGQGFAPDSAWSRGAAWALYGFAAAYRHTGLTRYLSAAKRVAHFFLASLPDDHVPYWDFRLDDSSGEPRDSSAAAIAASGLLELAELAQNREQPLYAQAARRILRSLTENYSTRAMPEQEPILLHATGARPFNGSVDASLIYGDYYYVEAIAKLNGWTHHIF